MVFVKTRKRTLNKTLPLDDVVVVVVVAVVARLEERAKMKTLFVSLRCMCCCCFCCCCCCCRVYLCFFVSRARFCACGLSLKKSDGGTLRESVFGLNTPFELLLKGTIKQVLQNDIYSCCH